MNDKMKAVLAVAAMAGAGLPGVGRRKTSETAEQMLARAAKNLGSMRFANESTVTPIASKKRVKREKSTWRKNKAKRGF